MKLQAHLVQFQEQLVQKRSGQNQCPHFTTYFRKGDENQGELRKIQIFLKEQGFFNHPYITGFYGPITDKAIRDFQAAYADEILKPWGITEPTGFWFKTTRAKENELAGCAKLE